MERWNVPEDLQTRMIEVARTFRKQPTPSEHLVWNALRGKKLGGRKFRRQQPFGPFVVDFFCANERLVVEVDGLIHEQHEADQQRQALLESLGLRFIRISAEQVETNLADVLRVISEAFVKQE